MHYSISDHVTRSRISSLLFHLKVILLIQKLCGRVGTSYGPKTTPTFKSGLGNERKHNFIICDVRTVINEVNNENELDRVTKPYILGKIKNYPRPI